MEKKEAMKILKDFHDRSALFSVRTALDTVIPELKESEDGRMLRVLREGFRIFAYDLLLLMTRADGIAMLPGWQASRGAQIENYTARHFPMMGISKAVTEEIDAIK